MSHIVRRPWTVAEDRALRLAVADGASVSDIAGAVLPGRTVNSVQKRVRVLGLGSSPAVVWSEREDRVMRAGLERGLSYAGIARLLPGRSRDAVRARARFLGLSASSEPSVPWSDAEDAVLVSSAGVLSASELANGLPGRSVQAVRARASVLGVSLRAQRSVSSWSVAEVRLLVSLRAGGASARECAEVLGRSVRAVENKVSRLGV